MEVKGTAVRSTPLFVRQRYPESFEEWLGLLSEESRMLMRSKVAPSKWYSLRNSLIEPTRLMCDHFGGGDTQLAWDVGRFSADYALWGLYRLFVKIGSPGFLIKRATSVFATYYRPSRMVVAKQTPNEAVVHIEEFAEADEMVELRIGGWMERALEISGCSGVQMIVNKSMCKGDSVTEFLAAWR